MIQLLTKLSDRHAEFGAATGQCRACVPDQGDCCYCAFNVRYTYESYCVRRKTSVKCPTRATAARAG
jgi:hypothetical protein